MKLLFMVLLLTSGIYGFQFLATKDGAVRLDLKGGSITGVGAPTGHDSATPKSYVDTVAAASAGITCTGACQTIDFAETSVSCNATHVVSGECFSCSILAKNAAFHPVGDAFWENLFQVTLVGDDNVVDLPDQTITYVEKPGLPRFEAIVCPSTLGNQVISTTFFGKPLLNQGENVSLSVTGSRELDTASLTLTCSITPYEWGDPTDTNIMCLMTAKDIYGNPSAFDTPLDIEFLYDKTVVPDAVVPVPFPHALGGAWSLNHPVVVYTQWVAITISYEGEIVASFNQTTLPPFVCDPWKAALDGNEVSRDLGLSLAVGATYSYGGDMRAAAPLEHMFDGQDFTADTGHCGWSSWESGCAELTGSGKYMQVMFANPVLLSGFAIQGYCAKLSDNPNYYRPSTDWTFEGFVEGEWVIMGTYTPAEFTRFPSPFRGYPAVGNTCFDETFLVSGIRISAASYSNNQLIVCTLNLYGPG